MIKSILPVLGLAVLMLTGKVAKARQSLNVGDVVAPSVMKTLHSSLPEYKLGGEYIILDFFATWCAPCVKSLEHYRQIKLHFGPRVDVVLLSQQNKDMLKNWLTARDIPFPVIAGTSIFYKLFPHKSIPHVVLLDRLGRVLAITDKDGISIERLDSLSSGSTVNFRQKRDDMAFNRFAPLTSGEGSYHYRSMFGGPRSGIGGGAIMQPTALFQSGRTRFMAHNMDLLQMYYLAFSKMQGTVVNPRLIKVETNDPVLDLKKRPKGYDMVDGMSYEEWAERHLFCYELITAAPMADSVFFGYVLQDLNRQFPFEAKLEQRIQPCWEITILNQLPFEPAIPGSKPMVAFRGGDTLRFINQKLSVVTAFLNFNLHDLPVRAADGLENTIVSVDIYPYATGLTPGAAKSCLQAAGLDLTLRKSAPVPVLVIRDK